MYKLNHMFVAAAAALTLTGCLKSEGDDLFKKLEPVRPGIAIYNAAHPQNMLSMQSADAALRLVPVSKFSLEACLEFLAPDELLEVTPENLRIRKRILNHDMRMKQLKGKKNG